MGGFWNIIIITWCDLPTLGFEQRPLGRAPRIIAVLAILSTDRRPLRPGETRRPPSEGLHLTSHHRTAGAPNNARHESSAGAPASRAAMMNAARSMCGWTSPRPAYLPIDRTQRCAVRRSSRAPSRRCTTGQRAQALIVLLGRIGYSAASIASPSPQLADFSSESRRRAEDLYRRLGGIVPKPKLRPGHWDLALHDGIVVEPHPAARRVGSSVRSMTRSKTLPRSNVPALKSHDCQSPTTLAEFDSKRRSEVVSRSTLIPCAS